MIRLIATLACVVAGTSFSGPTSPPNSPTQPVAQSRPVARIQVQISTNPLGCSGICSPERMAGAHVQFSGTSNASCTTTPIGPDGWTRGACEVALYRAGVYDITVSAPGFQTFTVHNHQVQAGTNSNLPLTICRNGENDADYLSGALDGSCTHRGAWNRTQGGSHTYSPPPRTSGGRQSLYFCLFTRNNNPDDGFYLMTCAGSESEAASQCRPHSEGYPFRRCDLDTSNYRTCPMSSQDEACP